MKWRGNASLAVAIAGLALAIGYLLSSSSLSLGTLNAPGAALYPRALGVVLLLIALRGIWVTSRASVIESIHLSGAELLRVVVTLCALIGYAAALDALGDILLTFLLALVAMLVMRWRGWFKLVGSAAVVAAAIHLLFVTLLGVPLPSGIFSS